MPSASRPTSTRSTKPGRSPSRPRAALQKTKVAPSSDQQFVFFDTETTGLHRGARIVEVAAVKFVEGRETERFETLVDPGERIPYEATAVHGITAAMVRGKPLAEQVLQDFKKFIEDSVLMAHYAAFDLRIVNDELQRARLSLLNNSHVCTRNLARAHLNLHSYRLEDVARHLGVLKRAQEHRALGDVLLVAAVCHKLQEHAARTVATTSVATRSAAAGTRSARAPQPAKSRRAARS